MNDKELDQLLRYARVPERPPAHWENVPKQILAKLHWQDHATPAATPHRFAIPRWGLALVSVCLVGLLAFTLWQHWTAGASESGESFASAEKCYREIHEMFPNQIRAIVLADQGSRVDLAKSANVPDSPPIFLKICGPLGCKMVITFSGQHVSVGGEDYEVLAGSTGIVVVGDKGIWTSNEPSRRLNQRQIKAKQLITS